MTAPKTRPNLSRKVTPGSEKTRQDELDSGVRITVDGQTYEVRVGDLTAPLSRELRKATGGSFQRLMEETGTDPDLDSVATVIWLARRIKGEDVALGDVEFNYTQMLGDDFDISVAGPEAVEDSPEA